MKNKLRTRQYHVGREPTLRDQILFVIKNSESAWTMKEIAEAVGVKTTTPYRALKKLSSLNLLKTGPSIDGTVYYTNDAQYEKLIERANEDDRLYVE